MTRFTLATLTLLAFGCDASACERCAFPLLHADNVDAKSTATEKTTQMKKYEATAWKVWQSLVSQNKPLKGDFWPAQLLIVDRIQVGKDRWTSFNAVAHMLDDNNRDVRFLGRRIPVVEITRGYLELFEGDENALALVLGHELGHHALGHTTRSGEIKSQAKAAIDGHRREADANLYGARIMLESGYSLRKAARFKWEGMERHDGLYSAADGACVSHPGTANRLARLFAILDKGEAELWRCMSAFENGVTFLAIEDFRAAEQCFARVTREFPNCHEAWANLGLARLMQYCDGLSASDLRDLGVGHFLGSTHYRTAKSLAENRGNQTDLWYAAEEALKKARDLKPGSPLVLANLGLVYLLHPAGKAQGISKATEYLEQAARAMEKASDMPTQIRAELLVNLGVARVADGSTIKARKLFDEALILTERLPEGKRLDVERALAFNRAVAVAETDREDAVRLFESYLTTAPRSSPWWPVAFDRYESLCKALGTKARPKTDLGTTSARRMQLAVALSDGKTVHVGEAVDDVLARLGKPDRKTAIASTGVGRFHFDSRGIYLIGDADEVFAVVITSASGPRIVVKEAGVGGKRLGEIRVGMTRKDVESLPGGATVTPRPFITQNSEGKYNLYDYYPDLGVAMIYDKDGVAIGIIIGQLLLDSNGEKFKID